MGMNYYWNPEILMTIYGIDDIDTIDPRVHIGKMSAAGQYCRNCGITRHGHTVYVHDRPREGRTDQVLLEIARIKEDFCPNCGDPWGEASSFTFTMMGHLITISNLYNIEIALRNQNPTAPPLKVVSDELGQTYSAVEILDNVIRMCPIQFQHYGRWS